MLKDYLQAIEYYNKTTGVDPNYTESYYWRGYSYFNLGKEIEAKRDVDKAISQDPNNETYLKFKRDNF